MSSNEPSGYVDKPDSDELVAYDVFVIRHKDGLFEWRIKSTDGRNWACHGYQTEADASAGAMHYFMYLMEGE